MKSSRRSIGQRASTNTSARQIPSSTLWQEKVIVFPSRIAHTKWIEIQNDEFENHIVNSIREEIVQTAIDILYKDYMTNRSCSFVINCAHTAWLQLFNWMHLKRDPGESAATVKERWTGDEEHAPVPRDNWVVGNVAIRKKMPPLPEAKICAAFCEQEDISRILPENISSLPLPRESFGEYNESAVAKIPKWSTVQNHRTLRDEVSQPKNWQSWKLDKVQSPRKLSLEQLPSNRLDVKYASIGDQHATSRYDTRKKSRTKILSRKSKDLKSKRESNDDAFKKMQKT